MTYETVLLSTYMEIARTGNFLLLVSHGVATRQELVAQYEKIVNQNAKASGDFKVVAYHQLLQAYTRFLAEYVIVKAMLIKLSGVIDYSTVKEVRARGYKIDLTNSTTYIASLNAGFARVSNLITKALSKKNEIEKMQASFTHRGEEDYGAVVANLNFGLGFSVNENSLTLAQYNGYKKILIAKAAAQKAQNSKMKTRG